MRNVLSQIKAILHCSYLEGLLSPFHDIGYLLDDMGEVYGAVSIPIAVSAALRLKNYHLFSVPRHRYVRVMRG